MRCKIPEPSEAGGKRSVVLDSDCKDALDGEGGTADVGATEISDGLVQVQQLFQSLVLDRDM
jgi:hypothetical protein